MFNTIRTNIALFVLSFAGGCFIDPNSLKTDSPDRPEPTTTEELDASAIYGTVEYNPPWIDEIPVCQGVAEFSQWLLFVQTADGTYLPHLSIFAVYIEDSGITECKYIPLPDQVLPEGCEDADTVRVLLSETNDNNAIYTELLRYDSSRHYELEEEDGTLIWKLNSPSFKFTVYTKDDKGLHSYVGEADGEAVYNMVVETEVTECVEPHTE